MVELDTLREAIAELSLDHRIVIVLRYVADLSLEEIADRVGIPVGTVKSRLSNAFRRLRELLGSYVLAPTGELAGEAVGEGML